MTFLYDESFGVIPVTYNGKEWHVFLIQHTKGKHWSFPKGHKEEGEESIESAMRELREETALGVKRLLHSEPFVEEYQFRKEGKPVIKKVSYFLAETIGTYELDSKEIAQGRWFSLHDAELQLTFPETKALFLKAVKILKQHK